MASPPMRLRPCDHFVCKVCYDLVRRQSSTRRLTCPTCRAVVLSTSVDESVLAEARAAALADGTGGSEGSSSEGSGSGGSGRGGGDASAVASPLWDAAVALRHRSEFLHDRSETAFYGIDNSGSMGSTDGKVLLSHIQLTPDSDFDAVCRQPVRV